MKWISVLSGLLLTLAFAPFALFPVAILGAAVVLDIWLRCEPRQAAVHGYLFGLAYFGSGVHWVYFSLYNYGGASVWFSGLATILFVAFLALYFSALGWTVAYGLRQRQHLCWLLYPSLWVLFEYLRSVLLTGFPWNLLGQSLVDSPFLGIVPVLGVFGGSWFIVLAAVWLRHIWYRRHECPNRSVLGLIVSLLVVWSSGFIEWTQDKGHNLTVSIVQSGVPQGVKFDPEKLRSTVQIHRDLTRQAAQSDLIVWSETVIPIPYHHLTSEVLSPLWDTILSNGGKGLLLGAFVQDQETGDTHNSIVSFGQSPQIYHKRHLVPFGEYIPLRFLTHILSSQIFIPMSDLIPGAGVPLLTVDQHKVGVSICYEAAFGSEVADALPEADYLVNVSNDSWFGDSIAPHQHLQIARLRALETGRNMVRATSTGISAMIDHKGAVTARSAQFKKQVLVGQIQAREGVTPYIWWGDWMVLLSAAVLIITMIRRRHLTRER